MNRLVTLDGIITVLLFLYLGMAFFSVAISNILLAIAGALFLAGLFLKKISMKQMDWKIYLIIAIPFILTILSVFNSSNMDSGFRYLFLRFPIVAVPLIILSLKIGNHHLKTALKVFIVFAVVACFVTFYNAIKYFNEDILFKTDFTHFITTIQHPYFGIYLLIGMISILEYGLFKDKKLKAIILLVFTIAIALTTSRIVYLLYFMIIGLYLYKKTQKIKFIAGALLIFAIVFTFLMTNKNISDKFKFSFDYNKSPRLKLWANSLEVVKSSESYLFGIGIGDYYKDKKDPYFADGYTNGLIGAHGYNPHSQPVEFYITNGFFGILILSMAFFIFFGKIRKRGKFNQIIFVMIFVFSLTECIFNRQYGVELYAVLMPLILKKPEKEDENS